MDGENFIFQVPMIFRVLCYISGMAVFLSGLIWTGRLAFKYANSCGIKFYAVLGFIRILGLSALLSLVMQLSTLETRMKVPMIFPELAILLMLAAFYALRFGWSADFQGQIRRIGLEILRMLGLGFLSALAWIVSFGVAAVLIAAGQKLGMPLSWPIFLTALGWVGLLYGFYSYGVRKGRIKDIKFHQVLSPILLACVLIMLPGLFEHVGNSQKFKDMLHAPMPLQRV